MRLSVLLFLLVLGTGALASANFPIYLRFLCSTTGNQAFIATDNCSPSATSINWSLMSNGYLVGIGSYTAPLGLSYDAANSWSGFTVPATAAFPLTVKICLSYGCWTTIIPCWSSTSAGCNAYDLPYQCNTNHTPLLYSLCSVIPNSLSSTGYNTLNQGYYLMSTDMNYYLLMQSDGNLVGYDGPIFYYTSAFWESGTNGLGTGPYRLTLETNSTLAIYDSTNAVIWYVHASAWWPSFNLQMQTDQNIVLYNAINYSYWASGTNI